MTQPGHPATRSFVRFHAVVLRYSPHRKTWLAAVEESPVIKIDTEDGDSPQFIAHVEAIVQGIAFRHTPLELVVVRIDNWFGAKWLEFSGKVLGALGTWNKTLTVPPFVPNRVVWERRFAKPSYAQVTSDKALHISTTASSPAVLRRISNVEPGVALVWFSGGSEINSQAAIMAYIPVSGSYWTWYAGWSGNGSWRASVLKGISANELAELDKPEA